MGSPTQRPLNFMGELGPSGLGGLGTTHLHGPDVGSGYPYFHSEAARVN